MPATGPAFALALGKVGAQCCSIMAEPRARPTRRSIRSRATAAAHWSLMQGFQSSPSSRTGGGAYGGNAARLRVLKRRFYPDGVFASAIPLPEG
jgi:hypothetical protein